MQSYKHQELVDLLEVIRHRDYNFTTITPISHERVNTRSCNSSVKSASANQVLRDIFGWSRGFEETDIDPILFALMQKAEVLEPFDDNNRNPQIVVESNGKNSESHRWKSTIRISTFHDERFGKQFFIHSAYPTTSADAVFFGPDTYRYLHEINSAINNGILVRRAVDIGAGAGPGAILMALHCPEAEVYAVDINQHALDITAVNAAVAKTKNVLPVYSDLLTGVDGNFDLIIANPPYLLDKEQRAYRHGGGDFGAGLSQAIVEAAIPRLNPGGSLLLYTGVAINDGVDTFKNGVVSHLQTLPQQPRITMTYREIDPDIFGEELLNPCYAETDRIAAVILKITLTSQTM